jgi:enoyl-CoA hydratase/carnithine racemase
MTQVQDLLIDVSHAAAGAWDSWQPLGFVDLSACPVGTQLRALPPFPLIGLGDPSHPLARVLDALVESPVSAEALIRHAQQAPHAAAVTVQLLRSLAGLPPERALELESMCYGLLQGSAEHQQWLVSRRLVSSSAEGNLQIERCGPVLKMAIDRPQARNAINRRLRDQLLEGFAIATHDKEIRSILLRAVGPAFSLGGDLGEFGTTRDPAVAHLIRSRTLPATALLRHAGILDVHVQGACVGAGLEMAAFATRVTAAPDAWFQLPELAMGLIPGAGGCVSVPRRVGRQRAGLMILSGRRINATTALRWGLIDAIQGPSPR